MTNEQVIREWFRRFWDEQDMSAVEDLAQPDARASGMAHAHAINPDEIVAFAQMMFGHIGNLKTTFHQFVDQGEWCAFHFTINATHLETGNPVSLDAQTMTHIVDGRIKTGINHVDYISFFQQIGLMPEQTLENCFAGCRYQQV